MTHCAFRCRIPYRPESGHAGLRQVKARLVHVHDREELRPRLPRGLASTAVALLCAEEHDVRATRAAALRYAAARLHESLRDDAANVRSLAVLALVNLAS